MLFGNGHGFSQNYSGENGFCIRKLRENDSKMTSILLATNNTAFGSRTIWCVGNNCDELSELIF